MACIDLTFSDDEDTRGPVPKASLPKPNLKTKVGSLVTAAITDLRWPTDQDSDDSQAHEPELPILRSLAAGRLAPGAAQQKLKPPDCSIDTALDQRPSGTTQGQALPASQQISYQASGLLGGVRPATQGPPAAAHHSRTSWSGGEGGAVHGSDDLLHDSPGDPSSSQEERRGSAERRDQGSGGQKKRRSRDELDADKAAKRTAREAAQQAKHEAKERAKAQKEADKEEKKRAKDAAKAQAAAEKQQSKVAKEVERASKGKNKDKEIKLQVDVGLARTTLWVTLMPRLDEMEYEYDLTSLGLAPLPAICWRRRPTLGGAGDCSQPGSQTDGQQQEVEVPFVMLAFHDPEPFLVEVLRDGLWSVVQRAARLHPGCTLYLLVVGLDSHMAKREKADFRQDFRGVPAAVPQRTDVRPFVRSEVELELAEVTLRWPAVRLRRVGDTAAAAEAIVAITRALATQPYENQEGFLERFGGTKDTAANRAIELELDRPGLKDTDTARCVRALCTLPGVGPGQALAVVQKHGGLGNLLQQYKAAGGLASTQNMLADIMYNAPGGSRRVGPAVSKKLLHFLTAEDPDVYLD